MGNPSQVAADRLRYDAAIAIERPMDLPEGMHVGALPALTWATMIHKGSSARISETFGLLMVELGSGAI